MLFPLHSGTASRLSDLLVRQASARNLFRLRFSYFRVDRCRSSAPAAILQELPAVHASNLRDLLRTINACSETVTQVGNTFLEDGGPSEDELRVGAI
jgi:hypothetical protein